MAPRPRPIHIAFAASLFGVGAACASMFVVSSGPAVPAPTAFVSTVASRTALAKSVQVDGNIQLDRTWDVSADGATLRSDSSVAGGGTSGRRIDSVRVRVGDRVTAGQVLGRLDRRVQALRLAAAEQELADALDARADISSSSGTITTTSTTQGSGATAGSGSGSETGGGSGGRAKPATGPAAPTDEIEPTEPADDPAPADDGDDQAEVGEQVSSDDQAAGAERAAGARPSSGAGGGQSATVTRESAAAVIANADSRVASARSALGTAKEAYANSILRAPVDEVVTAVTAITDALTGSEPLVTIRGAGATLQLAIDERDITGMAVGDSATVQVAALKTTVDGTIIDIATAAGGAQAGSIVTFPVTLRLSGRAAGLRDGMSATATIEVDARDDALTIPATAVLRNADGDRYVRVLDDATDESPKRRTVQAGLVTEQSVEIVDGLAAGDIVVVTERAAQSDSSNTRFPGPGGPR